MQSTLVQLKDVNKLFGSGPSAVMALRPTSLCLRAGQLTLVTGPSGSGKTTLLSIIGCVLRASSGLLSVAGHQIAGLSAARLAAVRRAHIGFVFQACNLFPALTAQDNVRLALDIRGTPTRVARVRTAEALAAVDLTHKQNSYPRNLSGGEKQRVAIARAIVNEPEVILADEPTAALDWMNGARILALLQALARSRRRAVVVVTHDPRALPYADRIVRMEDGCIVADDVAGEPDATLEGCHAQH